jgi:hypothetical protein
VALGVETSSWTLAHANLSAMTTGWTNLCVLACALSLLACSGTSAKPTALPNDLKSPFTGYTSAQYRDQNRWLCLPGRPDTCGGDLTATEIRGDGTHGIVEHARATSTDTDCFYIYPTVDESLFTAHNSDDFSDLEPMAFVARAQAQLFTQVCSLYVPLYRQINIGTYLRPEAQRERGLQVAFSDIADAFLHYMANYNQGRKIVLLGHSQGADMVRRLIVRFFEDDPTMRERLLLAVALGGELEAPIGRTTGGSFRNVPYCTRDDEIGCIVAYRSHREWSDTPSLQHVPRGHRAVCVNPGEVREEGARAPLRAYFPRLDALRGLDGVKTPYVFYRDLYTARCVDGPDGKRTLEIAETDEPGGMRTSPIDLSAWRWGTRMGTHGLDFQFAQGNLIEMVRKRAHVR